MSEILVTPEELRNHASQVGSQAQDARATFTQLKNQLSELHDLFRGQAASRFHEEYEQWDGAATSLLDALEGLGSFLDTTAEAMEATDQQLAGGL